MSEVSRGRCCTSILKLVDDFPILDLESDMTVWQSVGLSVELATCAEAAPRNEDDEVAWPTGGVSPMVATCAETALRALDRFLAECANEEVVDGVRLRLAMDELREAVARLSSEPTRCDEDSRVKEFVHERVAASLYNEDQFVRCRLADELGGLVDETRRQGLIAVHL